MSTILVVEDAQDNFDLIEDLLAEKHELLHAESGPLALELARAHNPDLILLDMGLPGMDGWEVARHLKADCRTAQIPVVALTAHAMTGDRERCLDMGCDDYMDKPIDVKMFTKVINHHLAHESPNQPS